MNRGFCTEPGCTNRTYGDKEFCGDHDPYQNFNSLCDYGRCAEEKQAGSRWCPEHHKKYGIDRTQDLDLEDQPDVDDMAQMIRASITVPDAAELMRRAASLGYIQPTSSYAGGVA